MCTDGVMVRTFATSLDTNELHALFLDEIIEGTNGVAATTNTRYDDVWKLSDLLMQLFLNLLADNTLEIADNRREGVWANT